MKLPPGVECVCGSTILKKVESSRRFDSSIYSNIRITSKHTWHCLLCYCRIKTIHHNSKLYKIEWEKPHWVRRMYLK